MSRVLFVPLPEAGHILPTVSVTRHLVSRGVEVAYLTAPQFLQMVESAGATLEPMLPQEMVGRELSGCHIWNQFAPDIVKHSKAKRLTEVLVSLLSKKHFDLVLFDRVIVTNYRCRIAEIVEPRRSLVFSASLLQWREYEHASLDVPLLVFCPEELEVEKFRYPCAGIQYVEPSLRPADEEMDVSGEIDAARPLVLVAFGTQAMRYRRLPEQYEMIREVARRQPDLQFVLATGPTRRIPAADSEMRPTNLLLREKIPQRHLLDRAKVFVSHGGLGSIKESIVAGVPLVVLPVSHDQPYNAMRVRHHGLGEALFPERQTVETIEQAILSALSGRYDAKLEAMRKTFIAMEAAKPSHSLIEARLAGAGAPVAHHAT